MSRFHDEVLPPEQKDALRSLAPVAVSEGFHLAGGTALAIQLGHRQSIDFDWFRRAPIADPLQLAAKLRDVVVVVGAGAWFAHAVSMNDAAVNTPMTRLSLFKNM